MNNDKLEFLAPLGEQPRQGYLRLEWAGDAWDVTGPSLRAFLQRGESPQPDPITKHPGGVVRHDG